MIIFSRVELQGLFQIVDVTENVTHYETSLAGKVDPGYRVILPVKFACKPDKANRLTRLLG